MTDNITKTTYVVYRYSGANETETTVEARDPQKQAVDAPKGVIGFSYYDVITAMVEFEGELVETTSDQLNQGGMYYIDAELLTSDNVKALPGDNTILLDNMRFNECSAMRCRTGSIQLFYAGEDRLVTTS